MHMSLLMVSCWYHQVPLMGNSEVFVEYQHWEDAQKDSQGLPAHVQKGYEKAQAAVKLRQAHEDAVALDREANADLLAAYMAYINLEQVRTAGHFHRIISLVLALWLTSYQPIVALWDYHLSRCGARLHVGLFD